MRRGVVIIAVLAFLLGVATVIGFTEWRRSNALAPIVAQQKADAEAFDELKHYVKVQLNANKRNIDRIKSDLSDVELFHLGVESDISKLKRRIGLR